MFDFGNSNELMREKRLAYYLVSFPVLSETFIQREVAALKKLGSSVEVYADKFKHKAFLDQPALALMHSTHYLCPIDKERLSKYKRRFFLKRPLRYLNLFLFVLFRLGVLHGQSHPHYCQMRTFVTWPSIQYILM